MADTKLVGVNNVPSGPVHSVLTITGTSIAEFNSMVQFSVREDPLKTVPGSVIPTEVGIGTIIL